MKKDKMIKEGAEASENKKVASGMVLKIFLALVLILVVVYFGFT